MEIAPIIQTQNNQQTESSTYPFEGCEKRLIIKFAGNGDLKTIDKSQWIQILKHAQCSILNTIENSECIAHLLSESSLFIFKQKLMIKTCGTTTLLNIIPILIQKCKSIQLEIDNVFYSRSNFMFPLNQPPIYRSFDDEVTFLNKIFDKKGKDITLGSIQQNERPRWHCYEYDVGDKGNGDKKRGKTLEIVLFDLDRECMRYFFEENREKYDKLYVDEYIVNNCCIPKDVMIDSYIFKPCGYSINGILNDKYWSMHITPEMEGSFVSFETNYEYEGDGGYKNVIDDILKTFKPKRFGFALNGYGDKRDRDKCHDGKDWIFNGFNETDDARFRFTRYHDVKWCHYEYNKKQSNFLWDYIRLILFITFLFLILC